MLTQCSCTYVQLVMYGFKPRDIRGHHANCMKQFKTLNDYYGRLAELKSQQAGKETDT